MYKRQGQGSISGAVLNSSGSTPISNALISVPSQNLTTSTDSFGGFFLDRLPTEILRFDISATGFSTLTSFVEILPSQVLNANFTLSVPQVISLGTLEGVVRQTGTTTPVSGALVSLVEASRNTRTDSDGTFIFEDLSPLQDLTVQVLSAGFTGVTTRVSVVGNQTTFLPIDINSF